MDGQEHVVVFGVYASTFNGYIEQKTFLTADTLACQTQVYVANSINNGCTSFRCASSTAPVLCSLNDMVYWHTEM